MRRVGNVLIGLLVILLGFGCIDRLARVMLFHPWKYTHDLPGETFEEVYFQNSKKQTLHGVYFPYEKINPQHPPVGTILYAHGNGENVSQLLDWAEQMRRDFRCNVLIFDYAGYGKSEGKPTDPGVLNDGLAALRYLTEQKQVPVEQIIVFGFSLGGWAGVA